MNRLEPLDVGELERMAREQYARAFPAREGPSPRAKNARATLLLVDGERVEIPYRGRVYELLPVSFEDGIKLADVRDTLEALEHARPSKENVHRYARTLRAIVAMAPKYLRPRGRVRRMLWPLTRNPFRGASDQEVAELLGFFLGCRMRSRVRYPAT